MSLFSARILYDFNGETENEISLREGDFVTVLNTEIDGGWWFGRSADGVEGMFPSAYVEAAETTVPRSDPGWGGVNPVSEAPGRVARTSVSSWGDEWNSTDEDSATSPTAAPGPPALYSAVQKPRQPPTQDNKQTVDKKPFPRTKIPTFGKSGLFDNYLSGGIEASATTSGEAVNILNSSAGYFYWSPSGVTYTCTVGVPKKAAKFGGFKAYMTYPVTPSFNNLQVSRRYKHFDWLHERLTAKYGAVIAIPPLPDKQVTGRFEEEVIENRRIQLQSFADRICRHPVLSQSPVWKHFITETDEKRWTAGKRKAESDSLVGPAFLTTLQVPELEIPEREILEFDSTLAKVEAAVKNLYNAVQDQSSRCRTSQKKEMANVGGAFINLGTSLNSTIPALEKIGTSFQDLTELFESLATRSWDPVGHLMHDYKGLTTSWGDILNYFNSAKERQKEMESGPGEKERIVSRSRINTYRIGILAEKNHFIQDLDTDLNYTAQNFVYQQIEHHREIVSRLETVYHESFSNSATGVSSALPSPSATAAPPPQSSFRLNPWAENEGIYEDMP